MEKRVKYNLIKNCGIRENDNILLGLSGGPDSVFLFHMLRLLKDELGYNLYCAHVNHLYRGEDAYSDEKFAKDLCEKHGFKCYLLRKHASEYAEELNMTEEEAGRKMRYDFFNCILNELGGGYISTAHNYNDQVETLLQRIIRGTGIDGLSGMEFRARNIVRPILDVKRKELEDYLHGNDYEYCIDKTNLEAIYGRNRIRLDFIPYVEQNYNPKFQDSIFRLSQTVKNDREIIEESVKKAYEEVLESENKAVRLDLERFNLLVKGLKTRVLRHAIENLKGNLVNVEFSHLEQVLSICERKNTGKTVTLPGNISIGIEYSQIVVKTKEEVKDYVYNVSKGKTVIIREAEAELKTYITDDGNFDKSPNRIFVDCDKIKGGLVVRNRRPGDRFVPLGMKGQKKLKDFFIDERIPRDKRNKVPVLADEENIIWIAGYRMSDLYKIDKNTEKVLVIEIKEI
ncbi:tRNA(Ile)-lysidine synthase [Dethiosulfatibacter aminovorans DSM 17477]|uniref:tRNA(Ile)-lysidine synthase n=1 Tax=Dethiosulfatibacter aminovorans DSM 17477 TaxID=1121476 RepID=A0A1M6IAV7_9FIRM|nr:tRNA lysidine(34) synthetase TilS [Dethiosulfatibacter aminovorans]SHJ31592.1 tRNA(Ile)-lysidine synthase [Dethiosulfatibacter aminovorans DSM 17477]